MCHCEYCNFINFNTLNCLWARICAFTPHVLLHRLTFQRPQKPHDFQAHLWPQPRAHLWASSPIQVGLSPAFPQSFFSALWAFAFLFDLLAVVLLAGSLKITLQAAMYMICHQAETLSIIARSKVPKG